MTAVTVAIAEDPNAALAAPAVKAVRVRRVDLVAQDPKAVEVRAVQALAARVPAAKAIVAADPAGMTVAHAAKNVRRRSHCRR